MQALKAKRCGDLPRVLEVVRPLGYAFAALPMTFDAGTERERHIQRVSKMEAGVHVVLDLLIEDAAYAGLLADTIEVPLARGPVRVVSLQGLLRMKRPPAARRISPTSNDWSEATMADMSAAAVAPRLAQLRELWAPMGPDEARAMVEPAACRLAAGDSHRRPARQKLTQAGCGSSGRRRARARSNSPRDAFDLPVPRPAPRRMQRISDGHDDQR